MKKKLFIFLLSFMMLLSSIPVFAENVTLDHNEADAASEANVQPKLNMLHESYDLSNHKTKNEEPDQWHSLTIKSALIPNVVPTGENLMNDSIDGEKYSLDLQRTNQPYISEASYANERLHLAGSANGLDFDVSGQFSAIHETGNVLVFNSTDQTENFRVVYCAIERNIVDSSLYFKSYSEEFENDCVIKLYLAPVEEGDSALTIDKNIEKDYVIIELFSDFFPSISEEAIENLPEESYLELYWYAKEFNPTGFGDIETEEVSRAAEKSSTMYSYYNYTHLGMDIQHYLFHRRKLDFRNIALESSAVHKSTMEIIEQGIIAPLPQDCSTTYSTMSLRNISATYVSAPSTAIMTMTTSGEVSKESIISSSFKWEVGIGLKGLQVSLGPVFSYNASKSNISANVVYEAHSNDDDRYWRQSEASLQNPFYLNKINEYYSLRWDIGSYGKIKERDKTVQLVYKFRIFNLLDYTKSRDRETTMTGTIDII